MGINNLSLTPEIIAALYPEILLAESSPDSDKTPAQPIMTVPKRVDPYRYLGNNLRSICFLVNNPDQEFIPETQLSLISKIMSACKCSLDDIAIINIAHQEIQLPELKGQLLPKMIFLWGVSPAQIGIRQQSLPEFGISNIDNILIVPVLNPERMSNESHEGIELKQRLWSSLKKLFNL
jgi:hypothetical protein